MPKSNESINQDLEDLLTSKGYDVTSLDSSGKEVPVASEADLFQFHFHRDGKDYGTVTATIDGLQKLTIYYDDEISNSGGINESDGQGAGDTSWLGLLKQLKKFAQQRQLGFVLKDTGRIRNDMKRRVHAKKLEESKMAELDDDLKYMNDSDFKKLYKMTKKEARAELKPKKQVAEGSEQQYAVTIDAIDHGVLAPVTVVAGSSEEAKQKAIAGVKASMNRRGYELMVRSVSAKPEQRVAANTQTKLDEGYYGNKKMSYSDDTPTVKMVIKHNRQLEETSQRFRYIESIFLETSAGERFALPTRKTGEARAFARHIAEGGEYKDSRWSHIAEICEDIGNLSGFVRATNKREQFNESAQRMISEAVEQYGQLRETLKRIQSSNGYNKYFESYEPRTITEDEDNDLSESFTQGTIDSRIERALPTLSKFGIKTSKMNESEIFEQWADSLVTESLGLDNERQMEDLVELLSDKISVGPNAEVAIGELRDVIEDDELYNRLKRAAKTDPDADARPQIIAWMQEQNNQRYQNVLDQIEMSDDDSNQGEMGNAEQGEVEEPPEMPPKKKQPQPQPDAEVPPMNESDVALANFKRLLGR